MKEDYNLTKEELLKKYNTSTDGISDKEAQRRIKEYGRNEIKLKNKNTIFHMILNQFKDMLVWLLIISAILTIIVDPSDYLDSILIIGVVIFNSTLGVIQEFKARSSLEKISTLTKHSAYVIREGIVKQISSEDVVIGDIVLLEAGCLVPADIRIIKSSKLEAMESSLTGESKPVKKIEDKIDNKVILAERKNIVFSSTFITAGDGLGVVISTGNNTEIGKIAKNINNISSKTSPLEAAISHTSKLIGIIIMGICIVIYGLELFSSRNILESFKSAISLSVAAIPEGLSSVITMVMALSVLRLSKNKAIIKRMPSAEALGAVSVIATDKTGTITTGNLKLNEVKGLGVSSTLVCEAFTKASLSPTNEINNIFLNGKTNSYFEAIPFSSKRKMETVIYKKGTSYISYTKGAFDVISQHAINRNTHFEQMAKKSSLDYRVLFVASKEGSLESVRKEDGFKIIGMAAFEDEIRASAKDSIDECKNLGVKPIMITGDFKDTAFKIASQVGIAKTKDEVITPDILHNMSDDELLKNLDKYSVYSRVEPLDKLRIIKCYQKRNDVIAMTGDGINDAPALRNSDIGIAMGNGSDIAKDAADMILIDNSFSTITLAINEGRKSYLNIQKTIRYLLSSNIGEVVLVLIATIIGITHHSLGAALLPLHLLWINLITDTLPAIALGLDNSTVINDKPRKKNDRIISKKMLISIIIEGITMGVMAFTSFYIGRKVSLSYGQTMAFITISMSQLFFSISLHGIKRIMSNKILNIAFALGIILTFGACYILGDLFSFSKLTIYYLTASILLSLPIMVVNYLIKKYF